MATHHELCSLLLTVVLLLFNNVLLILAVVLSWVKAGWLSTKTQNWAVNFFLGCQNRAVVLFPRWSDRSLPLLTHLRLQPVGSWGGQRGRTRGRWMPGARCQTPTGCWRLATPPARLLQPHLPPGKAIRRRRLEEEEEEEEKKTTPFGVNVMRSLHWSSSSSFTHTQNNCASSSMLVCLAFHLLHVRWVSKPGPFSVLLKPKLLH